MAKDQEIDLSTTAASNTDIIGVNVDEGMAPSGVNNAIRAFAKMRADAITRHVTKAVGTYTAAKTDHNQFWRCTGAVEIDLTAAATLTSGWCLWVRANGGNVTIDPSSSEQIDGSATSLVIPDGMSALIVCTGTAFFTWGFNPDPTKLTTVLTTNGATLYDITGIPSWAKKVVILLEAVSTNGTSDIIVQLGDAGGVETSGYLGAGTTLAGAVLASSNYTNSFGIIRSPVAAEAHQGRIELNLIDASTFTWVASGVFSSSGSATTYVSAGFKPLSAALDRIRLTTAGGVNTFDGGGMAIQYSA